MQASITKLEQTADQLHLTMTTTTTNRTALDEIKRDIQVLKELSLGRTQFPSIPQVPPRIPSWQLEIAQVLHSSIIFSITFSSFSRNPNHVHRSTTTTQKRPRMRTKTMEIVSSSFRKMRKRVMMKINCL